MGRGRHIVRGGRTVKASPGAKTGIVVTGIKPLAAALRVLGETEAPHLVEALTEGGQMLHRAARSRARGGIGAQMEAVGVRGKGGAIRYVIRSRHPGARSMEFGRIWFYRGYTGRNVKSGTRFKVGALGSAGQHPRPYLGVVRGDAAIGETSEPIARLLLQAIEAEWERIGAAGDTGADA